MPVAPGASQGPFPSVSAIAEEFGTLTFAGAGALSTNPIFSNGLPRFNAWFFQTVGPGVISVQLEFVNANLVPPNGPNWRPLIAPFVLGVGVPSLTNVLLGSRQYRATLTSTGVASVLYHTTATIG